MLQATVSKSTFFKYASVLFDTLIYCWVDLLQLWNGDNHFSCVRKLFLGFSFSNVRIVISMGLRIGRCTNIWYNQLQIFLWSPKQTQNFSIMEFWSMKEVEKLHLCGLIPAQQSAPSSAPWIMRWAWSKLTAGTSSMSISWVDKQPTAGVIHLTAGSTRLGEGQSVYFSLLELMEASFSGSYLDLIKFHMSWSWWWGGTKLIRLENFQ